MFRRLSQLLQIIPQGDVVRFLKLQISYLNGQCHEIFCFRFFSWITFPQAPENNIRVILIFFENSRHRQRHQWQIWPRWQIRGTRVKDTGGKLPPVSTTLAANLPPVTTTPAANFATSSACVVDTGGKLPLVSTTRWQICHRCHWHRWQIMGTISGCRHLKVNLKAKIYIYLTLLPKRCPNKII